MNITMTYLMLNNLKITNEELNSFYAHDTNQVIEHLEHRGFHVQVVNEGHYMKVRCDLNKIILVERNGIVVKAEVG